MCVRSGVVFADFAGGSLDCGLHEPTECAERAARIVEGVGGLQRLVSALDGDDASSLRRVDGGLARSAADTERAVDYLARASSEADLLPRAQSLQAQVEAVRSHGIEEDVAALAAALATAEELARTIGSIMIAAHEEMGAVSREALDIASQARSQARM